MISISQLPAESWQDYRTLRLEALLQDPLAFGSTYDEELHISEEQWRERIKNIWFAFIEEQVVGMIGLIRDTGLPGEHRAHLISFWTQPAHRGKGIGKNLILHVQEQGRRIGLRKIYLHVTTTQESAIKLYESLGFVKIGLLKENTRSVDGYYDQYLMECMLEKK